MGDYILRSLGIKLAECFNNTYNFYPYAFYRLASPLLFFVSSAITFIIFYIVDFKSNIYILYLTLTYIVVCCIILKISYKSIKISKRDRLVDIIFFSKKSIRIENIRNIYRLTKTKYEYNKVERSTVFYLHLCNDKKIRLSPNLLNYSKKQRELLNEFDLLMERFANDIQIDIVNREVGLNRNVK